MEQKFCKSFSHTLGHVLPEDIQMFLFMENNRLGSFFKHLSTITQTKALDTHPCHIYTGSDMIVKLILIILIVNTQKCIAFCLQLPLQRMSSDLLCCASPHIAENNTLLDSCMGKPGGTLMMLVNNISHSSSFRWKALIMLHLTSSGPQASQQPWPTFLAITDVLAK